MCVDFLFQASLNIYNQLNLTDAHKVKESRDSIEKPHNLENKAKNKSRKENAI